MDIEGGQVGPRAAAVVLVLDFHGYAGLGWQRRVLARASLDAGLLIGGQHELVFAQELPLPASLVEVEDAARLDGKLRVSRKDPAAVPPGSDRILVQPAPDGAVADGGDQPRPPHLLRHLGYAPARQRQLIVAGSSQASALTCTTSSGGKSPGSTRASLFFQSRQSLLEKAFAPQADDFASRMQARSNFVVAQAVGGEEDHLGSDDLKIR